MRYKSFRIRNFKGIKDTTVDLSSVTGANVFALVGLNESGKTTILEAIHSFSPDYRSSSIVKAANHEGNFENLIPRHSYSIFTGNTSVEATLIATQKDKVQVAKRMQDDLLLDPESLADEICTSVETVFKRGDFVEQYRTAKGDFRVKKKGGRNWRAPTDEERRAVAFAIYMKAPNIAYYPTFIFDFPEKIWLSDRGTATSQFYRGVFADILAYDGQGFTIQKDILDRVRGEDFVLPWLEFVTRWREETNKAKIRHIIDRAQKVVTEVVFGKWNQLFGEDVRDREVVIEFEVDEGKVRSAEGKLVSSNAHDPYITFQIKHGTRRFDVNDRSLGFRWFFAFLLFTQFRTAATSGLPTLFLFDEPASNLHAAAQQQLIGGFPAIARGDNMLIYSTHSHYMIEPKWLEQTFIVTNRADAPMSSVIDTAVLDDESLDINADRYRSFVSKNPSKTSYFQPVLDRLNVVPSRLDQSLPSIVLEGKSDYYILRYLEVILGREELRLIPGVGAGTFEALIGLSVGWGTKFLFVLDADDKGLEEKERYVSDFGAPIAAVVALKDLIPTLSKIEDLFDVEALTIISGYLQVSGRITKKQILRFTQEQLAKGEAIYLGNEFAHRGGALLDALKVRLEAL
jgi:ABC-type Na+ transport system ATPase subunit NatA